MGDISSGPTGGLPGNGFKPPEGEKCDLCDSMATHRIQGETDSFGCEYHDLCDKHYKEFQEGQRQRYEEERECDWCKKMKKGLAPARDYDEGSRGPVYDVCEDCRKKQSDAIQEELDRYADYDPLYDDHDYMEVDYNEGFF